MGRFEAVPTAYGVAMISYEDIPVQVFVAQKYHTPQVQKFVEEWRVEPESVIDKIVDHFKELGIFRVGLSQHRIIQDAMMTYLRTSPEIQKMVLKLRAYELRRQRNRHAD